MANSAADAFKNNTSWRPPDQAIAAADAFQTQYKDRLQRLAEPIRNNNDWWNRAPGEFRAPGYEQESAVPFLIPGMDRPSMSAMEARANESRRSWNDYRAAVAKGPPPPANVFELIGRFLFGGPKPPSPPNLTEPPDFNKYERGRDDPRYEEDLRAWYESSGGGYGPFAGSAYDETDKNRMMTNIAAATKRDMEKLQQLMADKAVAAFNLADWYKQGLPVIINPLKTSLDSADARNIMSIEAGRRMGLEAAAAVGAATEQSYLDFQRKFSELQTQLQSEKARADTANYSLMQQYRLDMAGAASSALTGIKSSAAAALQQQAAEFQRMGISLDSPHAQIAGRNLMQQYKQTIAMVTTQTYNEMIKGRADLGQKLEDSRRSLSAALIGSAATALAQAQQAGEAYRTGITAMADTIRLANDSAAVQHLDWATKKLSMESQIAQLEMSGAETYADLYSAAIASVLFVPESAGLESIFSLRVGEEQRGFDNFMSIVDAVTDIFGLVLNRSRRSGGGSGFNAQTGVSTGLQAGQLGVSLVGLGK